MPVVRPEDDRSWSATENPTMKKTKEQMRAETEALLARSRVQVTRLPADASSGLTPKDWAAAARGRLTEGNLHVMPNTEHLTDGANELQRRREEAGYYKS